jgi:HK97 family phage portal protein
MGLLDKIIGPAVARVLKDVKASPNSPTLIKMFGLGDSDDLRSPYSQLPIIYAAVRAVAKVLSQTAWKVLRGEDEVGENDPLVKLLQRPNPKQSEYEFKEAIGTNLQVKGNAFWVLSEEMVKGLPIALYAWPADYFKPHYDSNKMWDGWTVKRNGEFFLKPERVVHIANYNIGDELMGMAPLDVLKMTYKSQWDALVYNKKFFENDGTPPIIYKSANILPDQYREAWKKDLIERRRGVKHSHEAQLIEGMEVQTLGFTQKDIQFLELLKRGDEEALMVFGVTKTQVSKYEDVNYATALSQDKVFISNTCIPLMRQIEAEVNAQWLNAIGYTLKFDERSNEAMTYLSAEEAQKVVSISNAKLITVNEAREMIGLDPVPWGDEEPGAGEIPEQLQPFVGPQPKKPEPKKPTPEKPEEVEEAKKVAKDLEEALGKARRANTWQSINNRIKPVEVRCAKAVRKYFYGIEKKMLGLVSKGIAKDVADPDIDLVFDDEELIHIVNQYLGQAISVGYSTMGIGEVNIDDPGINQYLGSRVEYMRGVNDNAKVALKEKLHDVLVDAMEQQMTEVQRTEAIETMIREEFASLKSHARTIARTEVHGAMADGRWKACEELQPDQIEWVSSRDMLVRDSHAALDGKRVPFGDRFANGCKYPLDPMGGAAEVCNCRCTFQVHY